MLTIKDHNGIVLCKFYFANNVFPLISSFLNIIRDCPYYDQTIVNTQLIKIIDLVLPRVISLPNSITTQSPQFHLIHHDNELMSVYTVPLPRTSIVPWILLNAEGNCYDIPVTVKFLAACLISVTIYHNTQNADPTDFIIWLIYVKRALVHNLPTPF